MSKKPAASHHAFVAGGGVSKKPAASHHAKNSAIYTACDKCILKNCDGMLRNRGEELEAYIWNGAEWSTVVHGRKQCWKCQASYRMNFVWSSGAKLNTITKTMFDDPNSNIILLVENYIGFPQSYLKQLMIRQFRCATSLLGEASTILQSYPNVRPLNEINLSRRLGEALMMYLSFTEGRFGLFDCRKPVKNEDDEHGCANDGLHIIFDAWQHDPGLDRSVLKRDVVSDGNKVLTRKLESEEIKNKKRGTGRPNKKKEAAKAKKNASKSRCAAVNLRGRRAVKEIDLIRTEGVYAVVDMRTTEVLVFAEMLNAECNPYKHKAADIVAGNVRVRTHCHDCACNATLQSERCLLDAWHALKHKCDKKKYDPSHKNNAKWVEGCNTSAAEQLWSRTDKLAVFCTRFGRGNFRMFLRCYCAWRNGFVRDGRYASDTSKTRSWKRAVSRHELVIKKPAASKQSSPSRKKPASVCQTHRSHACEHCNLAQ